MITYGFSIQGKSHIKNDIVCQDSNKIGKLKSGHYIGIVADGVGSAPYSDTGSQMVVNCLFEYCDNHITKKHSTNNLQQILEEGYDYAFSKIKKLADNKGENIADYDTTLSVALYKDKKVIYGHAGDGGIVVKCKDGIIKPITTRQKGADGTSVMPLRAGRKSWKFGVCEDEVVAVMLLTDGMLDGVIQPVFVNLPPNIMAMAKGDFKKDNVYVTASEFFLNPYAVYQNKVIKDPDQFMAHFINGNLLKKDEGAFFNCINNAYVNMLGKNNGKKASESIKKYYYAVWAIKNVTDDKTVVCLINNKEKVKPQIINYYLEPDWKERQKKYNELLYGKETIVNESDKTELVGEENKIRVKEKVSQNKKRNLNVKYILLVVVILILVIVSFSVGVFIGKRKNKVQRHVDITTIQSNTTAEAQTTSDEVKVEKNVNRFMDNLSKFDGVVPVELKKEFTNQVNINGFEVIIRTIKTHNLNKQDIDNKRYNKDFCIKETESIMDDNLEITAENSSDNWVKNILDSEVTESITIQNTGEITNAFGIIDCLEKIMEDIKYNNNIELFKDKVMVYLSNSNNSEKIKLIKQNISMLYSE